MPQINIGTARKGDGINRVRPIVLAEACKPRADFLGGVFKRSENPNGERLRSCATLEAPLGRCEAALLRAPLEGFRHCIFRRILIADNSNHIVVPGEWVSPTCWPVGWPTLHRTRSAPDPPQSARFWAEF